jgi:nucleoside-diphosphate-sugar epimerase
LWIATRLVLEEASYSQIERAVFTGSTVTIGYSSDQSTVLDESNTERSRASPYHTAKWEAEQLALEFSRNDHLSVIVVNPSSVVGSLDFRVTPSTAPTERCLDGGLPIAFAGGITIVMSRRLPGVTC